MTDQTTIVDYLATPPQRFDKQAYDKAYKQTPKYREYLKKYNRSQKRKNAQNKYNLTRKGKTNLTNCQKRYIHTPRYKLLRQKPERKESMCVANLNRIFPGTSVATRKEIVACKKLIKTLKGDQ